MTIDSPEFLHVNMTKLPFSIPRMSKIRRYFGAWPAKSLWGSLVNQAMDNVGSDVTVKNKWKEE